MKCTILIGYMCVGKTTIGRELAKQTGRMFYDLDWYIEERFRKKIPLIFEEEGEERFRDMERRMLHEVAEFEDIVLSCGGGTPCFFDNMEYMNSVAHTFYLRATAETLQTHIRMSRGRRPLLEGKSPEELDQFIKQQLAERSLFYEQAQHIIDVDVLSNEEKVEAIVAKIREGE